MASDADRLQTIFAQLSPADRASLLAFAEFLQQRQTGVLIPAPRLAEKPEVSSPRPQEPEAIPRPAGESVIKAVKRLSATYPMLDKNALLGETSELVTQHVVMGRDKVDVIDTLEVIFERRYQEYLAQFEQGGEG